MLCTMVIMILIGFIVCFYVDRQATRKRYKKLLDRYLEISKEKENGNS